MQKADAFIRVDSSSEIPYELQVLDKALHYQQWIIETIKPFLGTHILELGAGIGNMSRWLTPAAELVLTESDPNLLQLLKTRMQSVEKKSDSITTHLFDVTKDSYTQFDDYKLDTIISFNVLEHIEDDLNVLANCTELLKRSSSPNIKRIITFIPAHNWAFGMIDKKVGHYRRYNQEMFRVLHRSVAPDARLILKPFNFVGLWGWILSGRILKKSAAGTKMISLFEILCPLIKQIDNILINKFHIPCGQSLIAIQEFTKDNSCMQK